MKFTRLSTLRDVSVRSFRDFFRDGGLMLAGSLSYFSIMAIVPFCLLVVALLGYILGQNEDLLIFFSDKLMRFFPVVTREITEELQKVITYRGIGPFTLAVYSIISYHLFSAIETSLNTVFGARRKRTFLASFIMSLGIITAISALVTVSFGATSAVSVLESIHGIPPVFRIGKAVGFIIGYAVPLMLLFFTIAVLYIFLPLAAVGVRRALKGALLSACLIEMAKHVFTFYVIKVAKMGTLYGPLSTIVIFLLWVYYSSCIFIMGAEVVKNLETS